MVPSAVRPAIIPWHRRMEVHAAAGAVLLVVLSISAVLVATIRLFSGRSFARASEDVRAARQAFQRVADVRADMAAVVVRLVADLPEVRAALAPAAPAGVPLDADGYRRRLDARFAIFTDPSGRWTASSGWPDPSDREALAGLLASAAAGRPDHALLFAGSGMFLAVAEPVRDDGAVIGALAAGYAIDDGMAAEVAASTQCELSVAAGGALVASSLRGDRRAGLERALRDPAWLPDRRASIDIRTVAAAPQVAGAFALDDVAGSGAAALIVLEDWEPTEQLLAELRSTVLLDGALILACALAASVALGRRTSRPLRELAVAAREIAEGRWHRPVPVRGSAEATELAAAFNDMSRSLRGAQERLVHDAFHDHLTQLPNRALFMDRLQQSIARRTRHPRYAFAVLFIDLDRFKTVNDSIGHPAGDRLLLLTASRLTAVLRQHDTTARAEAPEGAAAANTLARVGGDEFTIILEDVDNARDAVRVAERLQHAISAPLTLDGHSVFPTASIGIALSSAAHQSCDDLVRDADIAMYRAKATGGNCAAVFDATMHALAVERLQLEGDLRRALERGEFRLEYQPIMSLRDRRPVGFEALLRWDHPDRGLLEPSSFIRIAEETGLITRVDDWVLQQACVDAHRWQAELPRDVPLSVSVNISGQSFGRHDLVEQVARTLGDTRLDPYTLRLEITESVAMADAERARSMLADLKSLGIRISLDDFGTGYSSLSYLLRFPVDTLKIDRSFVATMDQKDECREIIRTVLNLAITLDLEVIAEGTETEAQVDYLVALGCPLGQGYFFSRALAFDEVIAFARGRASLPAPALLPAPIARPA